MSEEIAVCEIQDGKLIKDSPTELVNAKVRKFRLENENRNLVTVQSQATRNEEKRKQNLAKCFIREFNHRNGISSDQLYEIINSLSDSDIVALDNDLIVHTRKTVRIANAFGLFAVGLLPLNILLLFIYDAFFTAGVSVILTGIVCFAGAMYLDTNRFNGDTSMPIASSKHLALRRYLKKKYGEDYFPCQELRKLLEPAKKE